MIVPAAYAFSRRQFVGRKRILYGYVLFTQIGAGLSIATLVALYSLFSSYGLTNNLFILGLFYAASAIPFNTWLLKTYMDNIPISYEEAAMVDGASFLDTIREVILPLTKPGLAVVLIFVWLAGWNEFIIAQTLLRLRELPALGGAVQHRDRGAILDAVDAVRGVREPVRAPRRGRLLRGAALRRRRALVRRDGGIDGFRPGSPPFCGLSFLCLLILRVS